MKKQSGRVSEGSPLPLRVIHGLIFGGFTAICVVAAWPEVVHLVKVMVQPFHVGPPPRPALLVALVTSLVGMTVVLVQGARGRSAGLLWSVLVIGAVALASWGNREGPETGRSSDAANLRILRATRTLHGQTMSELQNHGSVPEDEGSWQMALEKVTEGRPTLVRTRAFEPLPFRIRKVETPDALTADAPPGTLLLYVLEGGAAYELQAVGVSPAGEPWPLREPRGERLVFRGAFNPDLPPLPVEDGH